MREIYNINYAMAISIRRSDLITVNNIINLNTRRGLQHELYVTVCKQPCNINNYNYCSH